MRRTAKQYRHSREGGNPLAFAHSCALSKQIRVRTRSGEGDAIFGIVQNVNQQPVRADMALPTALKITRQGMWAMFWLKGFIRHQELHNALQLLRI